MRTGCARIRYLPLYPVPRSAALSHRSLWNPKRQKPRTLEKRRQGKLITCLDIEKRSVELVGKRRHSHYRIGSAVTGIRDTHPYRSLHPLAYQNLDLWNEHPVWHGFEIGSIWFAWDCGLSDPLQEFVPSGNLSRL